MTVQEDIPKAIERRQDDGQPTQVLPYWLSASYTTIPNPSVGGTAIVTANIVNLPLTYYGPSIPLGPGWVYGGSAAEGSIYAPASDNPILTSLPPSPTPTRTSAQTTSTPRTTPSPSSPFSSLPSQTSVTSATDSVQSLSSTGATSPTSSLPLTSSTQSTDTSNSLISSGTASSASTGVPAPAVLPPAGHLAISTGAIVGIVVGGLVGVVVCCLLMWCCLRRRRRPRRSYVSNDDPSDPEVIAGVAEGSSLLSNRLPGGESPPLQSPTLSTQTLRQGGRPRTPLSTRRFPYNPVPAGVMAAEATPVMEASRVSSDDVHRRSDNDRVEAAVGKSRGMSGSSGSRPRSGPGQSSSGSGSRSPPSRIASLLPGTAGILALLGLRPRHHEDLGEGWEEVGVPPRSTMGLGMHVPEEQRYTLSSPEPFPPRSLGSSSNPSRVTQEPGTLGTAVTQDRPKSFISGQTQYHDAQSRPDTPAASLGANEMRQREFGMISRPSLHGSEPPMPPLPPAAVATRSMGPPLRVSNVTSTASGTGNPFNDPAYVAVAPGPMPFDDDLDAPPPAGLLSPGQEGQNNRALWTRSTIEQDVGSVAIGGLDDEPPVPAGFLATRAGTDSHLQPPRAPGLYTPSLGAGSGNGSQPSIQTDEEDNGRPWSGQVRRARFVSVDGGVAATRPIWTQSDAVTGAQSSGPADPARHTVVGTMTPNAAPTPPPPPPPPPRPVSGRDWTVDLGSPLANVTEEEDPYEGVMEYFRQNPEDDRGASVVIPTSGGGFQVTRDTGAAAAAQHLTGDDDGSEGSSLLAHSDNGRWRSLLNPDEQHPRPASRS